MIKIIYGAKGSGKTKIMLDMVNQSILKEKGEIIFLAETNRYRHDINYKVRFTNVKEHGISSEDSLIGFIKGMIACNFDIKEIYLDKANSMMNLEIEDLEKFIEKIDSISKEFNVNFILTASKELELLPKFIKKYI